MDHRTVTRAHGGRRIVEAGITELICAWLNNGAERFGKIGRPAGRPYGFKTGSTRSKKKAEAGL